MYPRPSRSRKIASNYIRRGKLLEAKGDVAAASVDYATTIDLLSKKIDADKAPDTDDILSRAEITGDYDRAMEDVTRVIKKAPKWAAPYELRARLQERKGNREAMSADYLKAIVLLTERDTPRDFSERARLYLLAGQAAKGLPDAELSLELHPDVPAVLDIRARLLEALRRREGAIADFRRQTAGPENKPGRPQAARRRPVIARHDPPRRGERLTGSYSLGHWTAYSG